MSDEAVCDLPIEKFKPGVDSLDDFFQRLELSIDLVHNLNGEIDEDLLLKVGLIALGKFCISGL